MENQHQKIKGYRELNQEEIDLINEIKAAGEQIEILVNKLTANRKYEADTDRNEADQRWVAIGKTHLQQGISALVRAVAKPESF